LQAHPGLGALVDALDAGGKAPAVVLFDVASIGAPTPTPTPTPQSVAEAAHAVAGQTLELLQGWLADERLAQARLAVLTRNAVAVPGSEDLDLAQSPVWGLVRSAQSEHPDRFVLIDVDAEDASWRASSPPSRSRRRCRRWPTRSRRSCVEARR